MTEVLIVFSTFMTSVMLVLASLEVAANAALHRTVSGSPRASLSGEGMAAWLTRLRDLFVPAVIAFVASAMCNIGTSVLLDDYRDRGSLWGAQARGG